MPAGTEVITRDHVAKIGDPTTALAHFYDDCVAETSRRVRVSSAFTRRWFERVLITPAGTRATAWQGDRDTAGMPNAAVAELENRHMLRAEDRAGARWYEINHDRFIAAIKKANAAARSRSLAISWGVAAVAVVVGGLVVAYSWEHGGLSRATLMLFGLLVPALGVTVAMVRTLDGQMPPLGIRKRWWWLWGILAAVAVLMGVLGMSYIFGSGSGDQPGACNVSAFDSYAESAPRRVFRRRQSVRLRVGSRGRNLHRAPARCPLANGEHTTPEAPTPEDGPAPRQLRAPSCGRIRTAGRPRRTRRGGRLTLWGSLDRSRHRTAQDEDQPDGSSGAAGTAIAGDSVPPSISNTLPVTQELASDAR